MRYLLTLLVGLLVATPVLAVDISSITSKDMSTSEFARVFNTTFGRPNTSAELMEFMSLRTELKQEVQTEAPTEVQEPTYVIPPVDYNPYIKQISELEARIKVLESHIRSLNTIIKNLEEELNRPIVGTEVNAEVEIEVGTQVSLTIDPVEAELYQQLNFSTNETVQVKAIVVEPLTEAAKDRLYPEHHRTTMGTDVQFRLCMNLESHFQEFSGTNSPYNCTDSQYALGNDHWLHDIWYDLQVEDGDWIRLPDDVKVVEVTVTNGTNNYTL